MSSWLFTHVKLKVGLQANEPVMKNKLTAIALTRSSHQKYSVKKEFLETSKNSQENNCARVTLLKRDSGTGVFL